MGAGFLVTMATTCRECCVGCIVSVFQTALSPVLQVRSVSYHFTNDIKLQHYTWKVV